jgi:hypothetical protein
MTWDCTGGVQLSATDENGAVTSSTYTPDQYFWRPSKTTDATLKDTMYSYTGANSVESSLTFNGGASTVDVLSTLDGMGRPSLAQVKQSPTLTTYDSTQTEYDSVCGTRRTSLPYSATAGTTNPTGPGPVTTFDGMCRPTQTADSGGGTLSYSYSKNDVLVTVGQLLAFLPRRIQSADKWNMTLWVV